MDAEKVKIYAACDRAIKNMNREALRDFGSLKMAKWDEVHVIRTVMAVYRKQMRKAKQEYYEVAFEAYLLSLMMCDIPKDKAYDMAEKAITNEWVDSLIETVDPLTGYRFDTEMERKAHRLAEVLEVATNRAQEIDKALRYWSQQCGQYAINATDYAVLDAYRAAGVKEVKWLTVDDERRCQTCGERHGRVYELDNVPAKSHLGCRCRLVPVK